MKRAVSLEPLQVACLFRLIGHHLGEIDQDLQAGEITDTTAEILNDHRMLLSSICDALASHEPSP